MALGTLGTNATSSLTSSGAYRADMSQSDAGTLATDIKDDLNVAHPTWPGAWEVNGLLYIPNRGVLRVLPGDVIGVDSQGWPILVSANSIAHASWTHA